MQFDTLTVICQLAYYFPYYVGLVLIPMFVRTVIEQAIGIRPELFEEKISSKINPLASLIGMSYETAFRSFVLSALYFPLFEELVFRGIPYLLFGIPGLVIGSIIWVLMHPAWQLQYLSPLSLKKKLLFTMTTTSYYALNSIFYDIMWINGAGLIAILYHIFHNGWLTFAEIIREVEPPQVPLPWRKSKYVKKPVVEKRLPKIRAPKIRMPKIFKRGSANREAHNEEEISINNLRFVVRKATRSLSDELDELRPSFVKKKLKIEEENLE